MDVATDGNGNVYTTGWTHDPATGITEAVVAKYSASGTLLWKQQLETAGNIYATGVATDGGGNVYVTGPTEDSGGNINTFVVKYSTEGAFRWKRELGPTAYESSVATDGDNNVYIAGATNGSLGGANRGSYDAFIAKYSKTGALLWMKQFGTSLADEPTGVATDSDGNVYISETVYFDDPENPTAKAIYMLNILQKESCF